MTGSSRRPATRALAAVLGAANLTLVLAPDDVLAALVPGPVQPPRWLVRLLGSRVLLQQVVVLAAPTRRIVLLGAAVDGLHAASMVAAALHWPHQRRAATLSAAAATGSAVLALATAPPAPPGPRGSRVEGVEVPAGSRSRTRTRRRRTQWLGRRRRPPLGLAHVLTGLWPPLHR